MPNATLSTGCVSQLQQPRGPRATLPAMGLTDKTVVYQTTDVEANVEPVVLFSIIDHFSRRGEGQDFVIGTLLGTEENGVVTISVAFPVPHMQVEDQMALSTDFHATMLSLHQRVHSKQTVVGWYSTGEAINANTTLFHEFYGSETPRPVHLLLDLGLGEHKMSAKAYISSGLTLGETRLGVAFRDIKLTVVNSESDRVGVANLLKMSAGTSASTGTGGGGELESVETTVRKLLRTLESVVDFVDKVVSGQQTAEPETVRLLQQLVAAAPRLQAGSFEKMFNTSVQDMLTVVYLANLTRTQLALAEKLQAVTLAS